MLYNFSGFSDNGIGMPGESKGVLLVGMVHPFLFYLSLYRLIFVIFACC